MPEFTDSKNQKWPIAVNGATIKRVMEKLKVDLGDPLAGDPPLLTRFDLDIIFKVDLIYVVCLPEAERRGLSDVEFAERLEAEALYSASQAFLEAWAGFFRLLRRGHLAAAIQREREEIAKVWAAGEELVQSDALTQKLERMMEREKQKFLASLALEDEQESETDQPGGPAEPGSSCASLPQSPESTPVSGPSAS